VPKPAGSRTRGELDGQRHKERPLTRGRLFILSPLLNVLSLATQQLGRSTPSVTLPKVERKTKKKETKERRYIRQKKRKKGRERSSAGGEKSKQRRQHAQGTQLESMQSGGKGEKVP